MKIRIVNFVIDPTVVGAYFPATDEVLIFRRVAAENKIPLRHVVRHELAHAYINHLNLVDIAEKIALAIDERLATDLAKSANGTCAVAEALIIHEILNKRKGNVTEKDVEKIARKVILRVAFRSSIGQSIANRKLTIIVLAFHRPRYYTQGLGKAWAVAVAKAANEFVAALAEKGVTTPELAKIYQAIKDSLPKNVLKLIDAANREHSR